MKIKLSQNQVVDILRNVMDYWEAFEFVNRNPITFEKIREIQIDDSQVVEGLPPVEEKMGEA